MTTRTQLVGFAEVGILVIAGGLIETKAEEPMPLKMVLRRFQQVKYLFGICRLYYMEELLWLRRIL